MNKDKLEQFMRQNREAFDTETPGEHLWAGIKKPKPKRTLQWYQIKSMLSKASAVVLIFTASYYFHEFRSSSNSDQSAEIANAEALNDPAYAEFTEAERYYVAQIDVSKDELYTLINQKPNLRKEIDAELDDLDRLFLELKKDLNDNADNQEVIEALMQNYRLKLEILEDLLHQIKEMQKSNENENRTYI